MIQINCRKMQLTYDGDKVCDQPVAVASSGFTVKCTNTLCTTVREMRSGTDCVKIVQWYQRIMSLDGGP